MFRASESGLPYSKTSPPLFILFCLAVITVEGSKLNMDYQVGIAYYQTDGKTAEELLEHCEMALEYSSSAERFSYYNRTLENKLIEEHKLGLKLSTAIKNKQVSIWLQPRSKAKRANLLV